MMADYEKVVAWLNEIVDTLGSFTDESEQEVCQLAKDALLLLKEQQETLRKQQDGIDKQCLELSMLRHKLNDPPQIVRCKDCKHKEESVSPSWEAWCNRLHCGCDNNWYCADGEPKSTDAVKG